MKGPKRTAPNEPDSQGAGRLRHLLSSHVADEVAGEHKSIGSREFAARALDLVRAVVAYRSAGLFETRRDGARLVGSVGFDQTALDTAEAIWTSQRRLLIAGQLVFRRIPASGRQATPTVATECPGCVVALPVRDGKGPLLGFLYVDGAPDDLQTPAAADLLGRISPLLVLAFEPWPQLEPDRSGLLSSGTENAAPGRDERARALGFLEEPDRNASGVTKAMGSSPPWLDVRMARLGVQRERARAVADDSERARLLAHLTHNEWNVARVARILGAARGTIYTRMAQLGIQRQRVRKSPPGRRRRSPA